MIACHLRLLASLLVLSIAAGVSATASAQSTRAIRRTVPMTDMIRRAFAAGTRDSTGAPGRDHWQTRVDYSIDATLDPSTSVLTGTETVTIHNDGQTSGTLLLPRSVAARSTATLEVAWHFKMAGGEGGRGHRMTARWAASLYQATQWFPQVAAFDDLRRVLDRTFSTPTASHGEWNYAIRPHPHS